MIISKITTTVILALLYSVISFTQDITVTVAEKLPVSIKSLDFKTTLDDESKKQLEQKGIDVQIYGTQTSPQGTRYTCVLKDVTKQAFDKLEDGWKLRLSMASTKNSELEYQDKFLADLYSTLLTEAEDKARPMALAMQKKLGEVEGIELLEYYTSSNPNSDDPYAQQFFAKIEVEYSCK